MFSLKGNVLTVTPTPQGLGKNMEEPVVVDDDMETLSSKHSRAAAHRNS